MLSRRLQTLGLFLAVLVACFSPLRDAHACGMFVPSLKVKAPPRMEQERTLIFWDASTRRQHFVREVRFANAGELPFGFIVPAPSRPEVNDVKSSPFEALEAQFPHTLLDTPDEGIGAPGSKGGGEGFGRGAPAGAAPPVQVLEKKRVGDFTSFVLSATDAKALADWLKKNQFRATEAGQRWIERYVKLGFFFVALRYEGKKQKGGDAEALVSRSVRFSFDSALPYYPYEEPADAPEQRGRELQVWLVTQGFHQPLALVGGGVRRPWSEGSRYVGSSAALQGALGSELAALVPAGAELMTFGDWKEHRRGFGDLVLSPAQPEGCDLACVNARRPLLALLDPSLQGASPVDASALVVPPPPPRAPMTRAVQSQPPAIATGSPFGNSMTLGCGLSPVGRTPALPFVLLMGLAAARRARRRRTQLAALGVAVAVAIACAAPPPPPPPPPLSAAATASASAAPPAVAAEQGSGVIVPGKLDAHTLPSDPSERQKTLMRLLAGHHDEKLIPVWSTPGERGIGHARQRATNAVRDPAAIEQQCAADDRVEGSVSFVVDTDASGATRAHVEGPLPTAVLSCMESVLVSAGPRVGRSEERGFLSLGAVTSDIVSLRRRLKEEKLVSARPPVAGVVQLRRVSSTVSQGLPRAVVDRIVRQHFARFRFCYERDQHPAPSGNVTLKFDIGPGGNVVSMAASTADVAGSTGLCIGNAMRSVSFPSPEGGRSVKVSFTLGFARGK